ncbi:unnamed protein product [Rotaria socialis]|uniref:Mediator of DNA damage checkpoint protein 1 n=1 Tax=Rotaria socialis TaxID=392032 RepID=A0A819WPC7_9BILA|nr:unnamed protein product [Rotaria socialis]CAF4128293.1 unnamed protein product [Rotaria socialis]
MTDLDNTQILSADESLLQNSSTIELEASLKIISGTDSNTYQIGKETIIGRGNPSDLIISAPSLSKQHAKVTLNNGQYFITDLGSSNKTFHNKIQLQPNVCYALHNGDELKLGDVVCLFQEQKQSNKNTLSESTYETYIPPVNTLVEEDSSWSSEEDSPPLVITESNVDVIPSTQTITDSYDDQEPTQPMKVWNGNPTNTNGLTRTNVKNSDDEAVKQNGLNESSSNKSSSFIPSTSSSALKNDNDDDDDDSLVIGATTLPATVALVIESTQIDNDDQIEILSSSRTEKVIEENNNKKVITETTTEIEIDKTQAYTLKPADEGNTGTEQIVCETQPYDLESEPAVTDIVETKREEVHQVVIEGDKLIEKITTTTTTTTTTISGNDNLPMETQAYDLEPTEEETTTTILIDDKNHAVETQAYDLQPTYEETTTTTTAITVVESVTSAAETLTYDLQPTNEDNTKTAANVESKNAPNDLSSTNEEPLKISTTIENESLPMDEQNDLDTTTPAVCGDTQQYDLDEQIDGSSPRPASETCEVVPMSKLAEQIQNAENAVDDTMSKQQVEVIINQNLVEENMEDEQMDTSQSESLSTIKNVEPTTAVEQQESTVTTIEDENLSSANVEAIPTDETEVQPAAVEHTKATGTCSTTSTMESEQKVVESIPTSESEDVLSSTLDTTDKQEEEEADEPEAEEEEIEEPGVVSGRGQRGIPRRTARRARGRRGGAARARVVSTRLHAGRRNAILPPTVDKESNNTTLEETVNTETEESPKKPSRIEVERKQNDTQPITPAPVEETASTSQANANSNVRVSARIKARASSGRNRQFPYADDYVDLDDLEKQSKTPTIPAAAVTTAVTTAAAATTTAAAVAATTPTAGRKSTRGGRASSASQKRISLRQQPIDVSESPNEKTKKQKDNTDVYEQMDTGGENEEPNLSTRSIGRKRKSTTPVATTTAKRTRSITPQTASPVNTRRKQAPVVEPSPSPPPNPVTPKRGRKSTKLNTPTDQPDEKQSPPEDRPVRIALSSHLNFDQSHLDTLRKLGFEIMDESCHVDALVVDRIRRTKKFFMCLARGAHILSPTWIDSMVKENRYLPYEKYYLEDTNAEARYGFQLRESVRLAKQHPIFENYKIFCTQNTSPPYDDLKDIIEAAGGKFVDKINFSKPGKDLVCIVAQLHKNEYEELCKKGVPIVSEEFALSGISKQKLDFEAFSLFQNVTSGIKSTGNK